MYAAALAATVATQASPAAAAHRTDDGALEGNGRLATPAASAARARETARPRAAAGRTEIPRSQSSSERTSGDSFTFDQIIRGRSRTRRAARRLNNYLAYQRSCRDPSSVVREPACSPRLLFARPGAMHDSVTMWERRRQVWMPEGRLKLAVKRNDRKDRFRIMDSHLGVVSSARGFVVTVGPVSVAARSRGG